MRRPLLIFSMMLTACAAIARVQLPAVYSSHMVLQQQSEVALTGKAAAGSTVVLQCSWMRRPIAAQAEADGAFRMTFSTPKAGGPHTMLFTDGDTLSLTDVLVGEVWLGSGQSNMEMPIAGWGKVLRYEEEIRNADYPMIRLLQVPRAMAFEPTDPLAADMGKWQACTPESVEEFSSLCYFYARELWQKMHIPVGIINASWGGTPAEAWTGSGALSHVAGYEEKMRDLKALGFRADRLWQRYDQQYAEWLSLVAGVDKGLSADGLWTDPELDDSAWEAMLLPQLFDLSVLPSFDGVVWFRLHIEVPDDWAGRPLELHLGMIDDEDRTYWNGSLIACGSGYNSLRCYVVPDSLVRAGHNVLTVRVQDTGGEGGIWGAPEAMWIAPRDKAPLSLAGEWKYRIGCSLAELPAAPVSPSSAGFPSVLFNAMIAPLRDFPMAGVIWYQGCANVGRAAQYESLFQTLICDWRRFFNMPRMPFYFVQLANYLAPQDNQPDSEWAALREAQAAAAKMEGVEMMVNIDLGEAYDIHPKNKQEVARRLALIALNRSYGKNVPYSAPAYQSYRVDDKGLVHISFDYTGCKEMLVEELHLSGFTIKGPDGRWWVAEARTDGREVVVWAEGVKVPVAVRYGWADNPTCTLRTPSGLHVAPFRTDNQ